MDFSNIPFDRYGRLGDFKKIGKDTDILFGAETFAANKRKKQSLLDKCLDELFEEAVRDKEGNVAKDSRGVDYLFADYFWTQRLEKDFPLIEQEFVKHCGEKLQEFNDVVWYDDGVLEKEKPSKRLQKRILRLIYNGAKLGDEYCTKLIVYLYKIYYKAEYKQLRGVSELSGNELMDIIGHCNNDGDNYIKSMCRILAMCDFMNVTLKYECMIFYTIIFKDKTNKTKEPDRVEVKPEHTNQISDWINKEKADKVPRKNKIYKKTEIFANACVRAFGYPEDFLKTCISDEKKLEEDMAMTLAIMKNSYPDKEYTFEEVQRNTVIYETVKALVHAIKAADIEFGYITGNYIDKEDIESMTFKPENVYEIEIPKDKSEKVADEKVAADESETVAGYLEEIASLRSKVREKESEISHLRELYKDCKNSLENSEKTIGKYESERDELIALREYAYRSELEIEPVESSTLEDMKTAIKSKNIVIIGGHVNWINRLKSIFPDWLYIAPDAYKMVDGKMLEDKDKVYFFTDYISHVTYGKFISVVREKGISFDYLGNTNMERLIKQIYDDMKD